MRNKMIRKVLVMAAAAALITVPVFASAETETEAELQDVIGSLGEIPETDLLHDILERGYLIVGTEPMRRTPIIMRTTNWSASMLRSRVWSRNISALT